VVVGCCWLLLVVVGCVVSCLSKVGRVAVNHKQNTQQHKTTDELESMLKQHPTQPQVGNRC
jgi:hypothetical protein